MASHDLLPMNAGMLAAGLAAQASDDTLQSLIVALLALAVRELFYWWRHRKEPRP